MNNRHPLMPQPKTVLSIQALSDAIESGGARGALFLEDQPNTLSTLVSKMQAKGYEISAPVRAPLAPRVEGRSAWQVTITLPKTEPYHSVVGGLLFYIPEDVS